MKVVLASSSKQRQDIFNMIGLKYEFIASNIEENSNKIEPDKYVEELSFNKAKSVSERIADKAIIIGADTIFILIIKDMKNLKLKQRHTII